MKTTMWVMTVLLACSGAAAAKDLSKTELDALVKSGKVLSVEKLEAAALARYPKGKLEAGEVESHRRGYVYEVEVTEPNGDEWDLELDATTGKVVKAEQD